MTRCEVFVQPNLLSKTYLVYHNKTTHTSWKVDWGEVGHPRCVNFVSQTELQIFYWRLSSAFFSQPEVLRGIAAMASHHAPSQGGRLTPPNPFLNIPTFVAPIQLSKEYVHPIFEVACVLHPKYSLRLLVWSLAGSKPYLLCIYAHETVFAYFVFVARFLSFTLLRAFTHFRVAFTHWLRVVNNLCIWRKLVSFWGYVTHL